MNIDRYSTTILPNYRFAPKFGGANIWAKNLNRVNKDFWYNLRQDPIVLRNNALILSSFLLVVTRILAVNKSSLEARGTSEAHHRRSEAIKTAIREFGGFVFSFLVLRLMQHLNAIALRKYFGLPAEGSLVISTFKHLSQAVGASKKKLPVATYRSFIAPGFTMPEDPTKMLSRYRQLNLDNLWFFKTKALSLPTEREILRQVGTHMKQIMTVLPVILGSIPTLVLSGYILERYTQKHANRIAEKLADRSKVNHTEINKKSPFTLPNQNFI
ncbi:MAG: hypothetical protein VKJ04_06075 [Vampirovibrionales bacterium]|nr:hypothetical protein [Vampirovibrionales bacterium]